MNENKVLVNVLVPKIEKEYEVLIPINKKIGLVIEMLMRTIEEMNKDSFEISTTMFLYSDNGVKYDLNSTILETDIRNNTKLILI